MKLRHFRAFEAAPPVAFIALVLLSACSDGGPGIPLDDEPFPAKGQSIAVNPPLAEILEVGQRVHLSAEVRDPLGKKVTNPRVTWETLNPSVATVDYSGTVTGMGEGVAEIRGSYFGVSSTAVVAVSRPQNKGKGGSGESVTVYPDEDTVSVVGGTKKLLAIGRNNGGQLVGANKLTWSTEDASVATVDGEGVVTGNQTGQTMIIVQNGTASDTSTVSVAPSDVVVYVVIAPAADTIPLVGGQVQLVATAYNGSNLEVSGKEFGWNSLDPTIASVQGGVVTGLKKGLARIVANHQTMADTAQVWVEPTLAATSLYITPKADTIPTVGGKTTLKATVLDGTGGEVAATVTWGTMDYSIATVSSAGEVTGVKSGFARITARYGTLVDTASIWVAPAKPTPAYVVTITPSAATVGVSESFELNAYVKDSNGGEMGATVTAQWSSLDPTIATVSEPGPVRGIDVTGLSDGVARIVATYNGATDTALVTVGNASTGSSSGGYTTTLSPAPATIDAPGLRVKVKWEVRDSSGTPVSGAVPKWSSMNTKIARIMSEASATADIEGVSAGTTRVIASWNGMLDTVSVTVNGTTGGGGGGTGAAKPNVNVSPATDSIANLGGTTALSVAITDTLGNVIPSSQATWSSLDPAVASVSGSGVVTGNAKGIARITASWSGAADTAWVWVAPNLAPPPGAQLTPANLKAVLGPIVAAGTLSQAPLPGYDHRYAINEQGRFDDFMSQVSAGNGWVDPNHYGGLRSRLMWAIRHGEPYGPGATSTSFAYGRGRQVVLRYLEYSKRNGFNVQPHHNTGLADVEALYVLEGNQDALTHIHVTAGFVTTDRYDYLKMLNKGSDARQVTVALQALMAAHRLGIPYVKSSATSSTSFDTSLGSWKAAGERQILWLDQYGGVKADGSIPSPAHNGHEAYLFNAWLATALLQWCANIEWHGRAFELARMIMDHLISEVKPGWETLGYLDSSTAPGWDLAAFYVWPSLALWQETGDQKYYDFAMANIEATRKAYLDNIKQFNQVYSTLGQGAEALMSGMRWR